uniref:Uncharacterized protein n=1 Tax=Neogobius melanostomus TaxID=47308 RepID=A0A8C6SDC4_9GOBI
MHCISRGGCYLVNSFSDVLEENHWTKERYQACWISLVLETRPQYRQRMSAKNCIGKERYEQQQVVHFIVERNMNQTLKLSCGNGDTTEHLLPLPWKNRGPAKEENTSESLKQQRIIESNHDTSTGADPTKPIPSNFRAVHLMSSPREVSRKGLKRE